MAAAALTYGQAREVIRDGDLLAWSGTGPISLAIRAVTFSKFSHVGIACWMYGRLWSLEVGEFGGGRPPRALSTRTPFYFSPSEAVWTGWRARDAFAKLDTPYSYLDAIRAALRITLNDRDGLICSEFARDVMVNCEIEGIDPRVPYTPGMLAELRQRATGLMYVTRDGDEQ